MIGTESEKRVERRQAVRVPVQVAYVDVKSGSSGTVRGYIQNVGTGGMGIVIGSSTKISIGTTVMLYFELPGVQYRFRDIEGIVRWHEDILMGIEFLGLSDEDNVQVSGYVEMMHELLDKERDYMKMMVAAGEMKEERRKTVRLPIQMYRVDIKHSAGTLTKGYIRNISAGGMCILVESDVKMSTGDTVMLGFKLPMIEYSFSDIEGAVRWRQDVMVGVEFMKLTDNDKSEIGLYVGMMKEFVDGKPF